MQIAALTHASEQQWLEQGRAFVIHGDLEGALAVFSAAAMRYPASGEVRLGLAGLHWQMNQHAQAEALLCDWLARYPDYAAATFLLVQLLRDQGRLRTAAQAMRQLFEHGRQDIDTVIRAVEMLDDYGRPHDALAICDAELAAGSTDPRLHAYAGMLGIQLGEFARVREHYDFALAHSKEAVEWNIFIGLASLQRYRDSNHPDFALFSNILNDSLLGEKARITTLFALGKAHDDIGQYEQAIGYLREANALTRAASSWSRKKWKRSIDARLAAKPCSFALPAASDWTPIFIVGIPRSGTTLLAELISKHFSACNRGETGWLPFIAQRLSTVSKNRPEEFQKAAALYENQLRQEDSETHWFIDKQPLNLLHVDLIMTMWPNARIIYCKRNLRDTALSLWSQSFYDHAHDYAYDFSDIAVVIRDCQRLMAHWCVRYPASIRTVNYEALASMPDHELAKLAEWLDLPIQTGASQKKGQAISTASAWQARQPVYTHSIDRWRRYQPYLPELLRIPEY